MALQPAITQLGIPTADSAFYKGFTKIVAISGKVVVGALVIWAIAFPEPAGMVLSNLNSVILATFNS